MPVSGTLSFTIFLGAALSGFFFYDMLQRWKKSDERLWQLEQKIHDTSSLQETQADTLQEHEQRIREKEDYDESDEIEENKYQAWCGEYEKELCKIKINLWREKRTTIKENQGWVSWNGQKDGSTTVRDFYLGNLNPDFHWDVQESTSFYTAIASETFVENWDNVICLNIGMTFPSKAALLEFVGTSEFWPNLTSNLALKKILEENFVDWKRILIDATDE